LTGAAAAGSDGVGAATAGGIGVSSRGVGASGGAVVHAASAPRMAAGHHDRPALRNNVDMWVILLEALGALALLVLIVWWTMFSGRRKGERRGPDER
jgi:hypothetical protein